VNSSIIYCKNFQKCHNVPPPSTTIEKKKKVVTDWKLSLTPSDPSIPFPWSKQEFILECLLNEQMNEQKFQPEQSQGTRSRHKSLHLFFQFHTHSPIYTGPSGWQKLARTKNGVRLCLCLYLGEQTPIFGKQLM
jgi:hypothetical protein